MAPNFGFIEPNLGFIEISIPEEIDDDDESNELTVVEIARNGCVIRTRFDVIDRSNANFSLLLDLAINNLPTWLNYMGCGNCGLPIAFMNEIIHTITATRHSIIAVGYVIPLKDDSMIWGRTDLHFSRVFGQSVAKCFNCDIMLTAPALATINQNIDSYSHDCICLIFDASAVSFYRIELR